MPIQLAENAVVAGRFRLNRMIGRGGMGSVWHATHLGLDIPCAVKFIEGEYSQVAEAQTRFEREAKAAAQLRSPHVVQILDHGVCDGTPYIAMELLDGEDLGKRLQRVGRMHPREISTVIVQVCRALTKAHGVGIVHRDLKPDNIFLVRDDDREIAKVLDFGIAKSASSALDGSNTKTGAMLGTPYYMSPEQAQGIKTVDYRSDLWSLAVIVYQCVTGVLPFESEALGDLLMKIIVQPIPVPSQVTPDIPPNFDMWWERASARDPGARFQSAKEFGDSLQMVFGLSQLTDVMDRAQLKAMLGGTPNPVAAGNPMMLTPGGYGAGPVPPGSQGGKKVDVTTGAPMARTFGEPPSGVPKRGAIAAIAGAATLLVGVAVVGGVMMMARGKSPPASAAAGPAATAPIAAQAAPAPPRVDPAPTAAVPPPLVVPATAPAIAPAVVAAEAPKPSHRASPPPKAPTAPAAAAPAKPAPKPGPAAPKDLGF